MDRADPLGARRVPILLYHAVRNDPSPLIRPYTVTPDTFCAHLDALVANGAPTMTVSGFLAARAAGAMERPPVLLTFDDGFADFAELALPELTRRGLASTLYVTTGFLRGGNATIRGFDDPMLSWRQLPELVAAGVEIGGHSHTHPHLDTLSRVRAREEILRCRGLLEDALGGEVPSFAYPNGYSSPGVRRLVREAGFHSACSVKNAFSSCEDDRFSLARLTVHATTSAASVAGWLAGRGAQPAPRRERVATRLSRLHRQGRARLRGRPGSDLDPG